MWMVPSHSYLLTPHKKSDRQEPVAYSLADVKSGSLARHHHAGAYMHAIVEINHIVVGHTDAA
jgi:hypothetical protein